MAGRLSAATSPALAVESAPDLYRALNDALVDYLRDHLGVRVERERLADLRGYLVTSPRPDAPRSLVLGDDLAAAEAVYLFAHAAAHILLGHAERPFATIIEPRLTPRGPTVRLEAWQLRQEHQADTLAGAMLWGCEPDAWQSLWSSLDDGAGSARGRFAPRLAHSLSRLLLGHKYPRLRRALGSRSGRWTVINGLRLVRTLSQRSGLRRALARNPLVQDLREIYCLTELVALAPQLTPPNRVPPPAVPRPRPTEPTRHLSRWLRLAHSPLGQEPGLQDLCAAGE